LLTTSTGTVRGAPSRGGRPHPPARALCGPPRPLRAGALRGGVTAPPSYVAVRAPVRACGQGAGQRARCRCVARRATALKASVLHARAWNAARGVSVMTQFVTTVPVRDNSGLCGKSTVCTHEIGFGGDRKEGKAPIYQFFKKEQKQAGKLVAHC